MSVSDRAMSCYYHIETLFNIKNKPCLISKDGKIRGLVARWNLLESGCLLYGDLFGSLL